jgi:hypothetical protein
MRSSTAIARDDHAAPELTAFTRELSDPCRKYGFGLGGATLFEMQSDDYRFDYHVDDDSKLVLR